MPQPYPTLIPRLRSPSERIVGIAYFGRMLDKIRLFAEHLDEGRLKPGGKEHAMKPMQSCHPIKPEDIFWPPSRL